MPIRREFLGWDQPALQVANDWLVERYRTRQRVDMDNVLVVVPGGRAGRRLREILLARVGQLRVAFFPPRITTAGQLPELLYEPGRQFAGELVQQLAWAQALRQSDRERLRLVIPELPTQVDDPRWIEMGNLLRRQHRELAGDCLDFSDVAREGNKIEGFTETKRWQILADIQARYLRILDSLQLWDRQTARLVAIQHRECAAEGDIVLLGMADMNRALRQMVDQVARNVTAIVFAPADRSDYFDGHGCLQPRAWQDTPVRIEPEQLRVVEGPDEQVDEVVRVIAGYDGKYRADQITVGVPDERLVTRLQRRLARAQLPARWGPGVSITESAAYRFLQATASYVQSGHYDEFAALVRHPDVERWLERQGEDGDWITELDQYYGDHLPARLGSPWLGRHGQSRQIRRVVEHVHALLQPLIGATHPPARWGEALVDLLRELYGHGDCDLDDPGQRHALLACEEILDAVRELSHIPDGMAPKIGGADAIRLALTRLGASGIPAAGDDDAIELLGWLELPLDDAPALVVTSCHEGIVPESVNSDLFLPNSLRSRLKLDDNARRYARDAYSLSVLLASRQNLTLIVARRDDDGNPELPSRLLFADDEHRVAERARVVFDDSLTAQPIPRHTVDAEQLSKFLVPRPRPLDQPITKLSPSAFRLYLSCPYQFYLSYVLGLESISDDVHELDGAAFGVLVHEVLRRFGTGPTRDSSDAEEIATTLREELQQCVHESFGQHPVAAVRVQVQQLRQRLEAAATAQAQWRDQGWRIVQTEVTAPDDAMLQVDDQLMRLTGRIDRIDRNDELDAYAILDYKSSDTGAPPDKTHRRRRQWVDLQLPLYRHIARHLGIDHPVQLGYFLLPKDVAKVRVELANWTPQEMNEADKVAEDVVRRIRREEFWPPAEPASGYANQFAPICQDGVFQRERFTDDSRP